MSTGVCTCRLNVSKNAMSLVEPKGKFKATTCPGFNAKNFGLNLLDGVFMGTLSTFGAFDTPKVDDSQLKEIQKKTKELSTMFDACRFQISNCRLEQTVDFMNKQIELNSALQEITDETQNQLIQKNMSLTYYSIAIGTLAIMYILAMPTPPPTFK